MVGLVDNLFLTKLFNYRKPRITTTLEVDILFFHIFLIYFEKKHFNQSCLQLFDDTKNDHGLSVRLFPIKL